MLKTVYPPKTTFCGKGAIKNMEVFEGKALYFHGVGGDWLFFNPVGGCLS